MQMEHQHQQYVCERCGEPMSADQRYCRFCGTNNPRYVPSTEQQTDDNAYNYASPQPSLVQQWWGWMWQLVRRLLALDAAPGIKVLRHITVISIAVVVVGVVAFVVDAVCYGWYGFIPLNPTLFTALSSLASLSRAVASHLEQVQRGRREPQGAGQCIKAYMVSMGKVLGILVIIVLAIGLVEWLTAQSGVWVLEDIGVTVMVVLAVIFWEKIKGIVLTIIVVVLAIAVLGFLILIWSFAPAAVLLILLIAVLSGIVILLIRSK